MSFKVYAQKNYDKLEDQFEDFFSTMINEEFDEMIEYFPENYRERLDEKSINALKQVFNDSLIDVDYQKVQIIKIGKVQEIQGKYYSIIDCRYNLAMTYKNLQPWQTDDFMNSLMITMRLSFINEMNAMDFKYNPKTKTIKSIHEQPIYAISNDGLSDWKFLYFGPGYKEVFHLFLPEKLLKK